MDGEEEEELEGEGGAAPETHRGRGTTQKIHKYIHAHAVAAAALRVHEALWGDLSPLSWPRLSSASTQPESASEATPAPLGGQKKRNSFFFTPNTKTFHSLATNWPNLNLFSHPDACERVLIFTSVGWRTNKTLFRSG